MAWQLLKINLHEDRGKDIQLKDEGIMRIKLT